MDRVQNNSEKRITGSYIFLVLICTPLALLSQNSILMAASQVFPALVAILLCLFFGDRKGHFAQLSLGKFGRWWIYPLALLLPAIPIALSYLLAWRMGLIAVPTRGPLGNILPQPGVLALRTAFYYLAVGFYWIPILFFALGEEIGWRGFLLIRAGTFLGISKAVLLTSLVWIIWHYSFILLGDYYTDGNLLLDLLLFSGTVFLMSITLCWLRLAGKSLWPAVIFHTSSNLIWQYCNEIFSVKHPGWVYVAGEAGMINLLFWAVLALWTWRQISLEPARRRWDANERS